MLIMIRVGFLFFVIAVVLTVVIAIGRFVFDMPWPWSIVLAPVLFAWLFEGALFLWLGFVSMLRGVDAK